MSTSNEKMEAKGVPIERAFLRVFQSVKRKLDFTSAPIDELDDRVLDALIQASVAKCVEFNIVANRIDKRVGPAFVLLSSLRGICEDLIYLTYMSRLGEREADELIGLLLGQNIAKGLAAQQDFFEANNPIQPVLTGGKTMAQAKQTVAEARDKLRVFWPSVGSAKRDGPTIRDMADDVGLSSTYEYIYFATSNFVHFNPQALFRMGWGPKEGPFTFSIRNMDGYYRSFSGFYGAVLFIGFHASFGAKHFNADLGTEIAQLLELIGHVHRWPEIITLEEMNQKPPLFPLIHALGRVMREHDPTIPYGSILQEVQALRQASATP